MLIYLYIFQFCLLEQKHVHNCRVDKKSGKLIFKDFADKQFYVTCAVSFYFTGILLS